MGDERLSMTEFSDQPAVLILGDSKGSRERARRSAELAGCRVSASVRIDEAAERLARQAGMDAVMLELEEDHGEVLDRVLSILEASAEAGRHGSVVSAPPSLIDVVAARTPHPRVMHLCGADEVERVTAIVFASTRLNHRLHDIGKKRGVPRLLQLSEEVGRIATMLALLSEEEEAKTERLRAAEGEPGDGRITAGKVRAIIRARRLRDHYFGSELFADPAWDILLDLYAARLEDQRVAVSSLCIAAAVPATTALRWIKTLTDLGLLVRAADPQDGRRVYIELGDKAAASLEAYLKRAERISPLNL